MELDCETGTSVSTIRGLHRLNTVLPLSSGAEPTDSSGTLTLSRPSSPHSPLPSPGSPSGDSVSSFPSVSSSFLFSSGPGSPPHPSHPFHSDTGSDAEPHDSTHGLIIPSLALPTLARRPTPYGQTVGDLRLLILAPRRAASSTAALVAHLVEENEDVVDIGEWEEELCGDSTLGKAAVRRASTAWVEQRDAHGLERTEPARNLEIVELPGYDPADDAETIVARTLPIVHAPFYQILAALHPDHGPSAVLASLLSSACTPLYTALVLLLTSSAPTKTEKILLESLGPHIPVIILPPSSAPQPYSLYYTSNYTSYPTSAFSSTYASGAGSPLTTAPTSTFRPSSSDALREGLFRTPETLALLRAEGAARFLRWREVERAVDRISSTSGETLVRSPSVGFTSSASNEALSKQNGESTWDKARWEAEWEGTLSHDIAVGLRRRRADTAHAPQHPEDSLQEHRPPVFREQNVDDARRFSQACAPAFDPLHAQSLLMFSMSLLGPLRARVMRSFSLRRREHSQAENEEDAEMGQKQHATLSFGIGLALVSAFCAGIGLGLLVARG